LDSFAGEHYGAFDQARLRRILLSKDFSLQGQPSAANGCPCFFEPIFPL